MDIKSAEFVVSNTQVAKCPAGDLPEYAFIGRSNVGKSSLINMLTGRNKLAMTSATPGKTLLINHFLINKSWHLVGYGYAKRSKREQDRLSRIIRDYILLRPQLTSLFVLIDVRHAPQPVDMRFIEWLGENGVPFALVFTKADKMPKAEVGKSVSAYLAQLSEQWEELPPHFVTSSAKAQGRDDILDYIDGVNRSLASGEA